MHSPVSLPLAVFLLTLAGDSVLITKKGEKYEGPVTREAGHYVVQTVTGPRRIPEPEVALVFESLRDATQRADERFRSLIRKMCEGNPDPSCAH